MKTIAAVFVAVLLVVSELPLGLTFSPTSPAFLWSNIKEESPTSKVKEGVSYQTLSPKDLAKSVMSEGGWSNLLCSSPKPEQSIDLAIVFVGKEPLDISGRKQEDKPLFNLLRASFMSSTFSLAYPYISASEEDEAVQDKLVSEFSETCGNDAGLNIEKLSDINSVHKYVASSMEKKPEGQTPVVVFTNEGDDSEGEVLSKLMSSVEETGAKYSVLYVSDPVNVLRYPSYRQVDRFLAESSGNASSNNSSTCDGVCQIKSSLLEGLFVGLVLLIILISGLCCMAGIDTPTRFEAPQD
ncbi:uncharacterized protein LOC111883640 [Lactuca sativa]|uniref:V-type proton ATPase subunit S1/VOA1 transmembrane domain-containing protein n=1 Tax=Lactuca sativa TaxID=4236 RepID=A0A9R1XIN7_LACSA|nr:uncharacterized protein LOC111883640 [Lactuca sativa]XP_042756953.1 uncharacterized protein LOC111883640 [Lactuca sativa]KAJ0214104.1 hypothetical protein LSAT_V11C400173390 [Lactuca sativa]